MSTRRINPTETCTQVESLLPLMALPGYHDAETEEAALHVAQCAYCQRELAAYREMDEAMRQATPLKDAPFSLAAIRQMGAEVERRARTAWQPRLSQALAIGATLTMIIILTLTLFAHFGPGGRVSTGKNIPTILTATVSTTPAPAAFLGTYGTSIESADIEATPGSATVIGTNHLVFQRDGTYSLSQVEQNSVWSAGKFSSSGTYLTFLPDTGLCQNRERGLYQWTFSGDALQLTAVSDPCYLRQRVLEAHPWVLETTSP